MIKFLFALTFIPLLLTTSSSVAFAQNATSAKENPVRQGEQSDSATRTTADETFELNITERRITERDYKASTSLETGSNEPGGLNLKVGVSVAAKNIDVTLRNVTGRVRFRGTLEPVLRLFKSR